MPKHRRKNVTKIEKMATSRRHPPFLQLWNTTSEHLLFLVFTLSTCGTLVVPNTRTQKLTRVCIPWCIPFLGKGGYAYVF